jgi:hypothetical protein
MHSAVCGLIWAAFPPYSSFNSNPSATAQNYWMKEMNFPIDIVWIDDNFRVVDIIYDARPESYPNLFTSPKSVKYVLELNSGEALKFSLKKRNFQGKIKQILEKIFHFQNIFKKKT